MMPCDDRLRGECAPQPVCWPQRLSLVTTTFMALAFSCVQTGLQDHVANKSACAACWGSSPILAIGLAHPKSAVISCPAMLLDAQLHTARAEPRPGPHLKHLHAPMRGTSGIALISTLQAALRSLTGSKKKRRRAGGGSYTPGVPAAVMSAVVAVINGEPVTTCFTPANFKYSSKTVGTQGFILTAT